MRAPAAALLLLSAISPAAADPCTHAIVGRAVSPNRALQAVVDETTCGAGPYGSDITATVRVGPVASAAGVPVLGVPVLGVPVLGVPVLGVPVLGVAVLGIDTGGHAEDRPRLAWSGADALDVTVPNLSFLKLLELHPGEVSVHLHFDPDDAAARKAWLAQHNLGPD